MGTERIDFAEFYRASRDDCLRTVVVIVGDRDTAQEVVAEALARACASWRTVSTHPAPAGAMGADSPVDPQILAALMRLPARQRQVVALRLLLDLDTSLMC